MARARTKSVTGEVCGASKNPDIICVLQWPPEGPLDRLFGETLGAAVLMNGDSIRRIAAEIEYRRVRRSYLRDRLPRLIAIYVHQDSASRGSHGEVIQRVLLAFGQVRIPIPLGLRSLAILDVLIRHKLVSAAQIERMLRTDSFCARLGASLNNKAELRMNRKVIKVYIQRIRNQLEKTLRKAGSECSPDKLLVSEATDLANVVAYRLALPCEIVHRNINGAVREHSPQ